MRLLNDNGHFDCGCTNRKEIMFTAGKLGLTEAVIITVAAGAIVLAWRMR